MEVNYKEKDFETKYLEVQNKFIDSDSYDFVNKGNRKYCLPFIVSAMENENLQLKCFSFFHFLEELPKDFYQYVVNCSVSADMSGEECYPYHKIQTLFNNLASRIHSDYNVNFAGYIANTDEACRQELYEMLARPDFEHYEERHQNSFVIRLAEVEDEVGKKKETNPDRYRAKVDFLFGREEQEGFLVNNSKAEYNMILFDFISQDETIEEINQKLVYINDIKPELQEGMPTFEFRTRLESYYKMVKDSDKKKQKVYHHPVKNEV